MTGRTGRTTTTLWVAAVAMVGATLGCLSGCGHDAGIKKGHKLAHRQAGALDKPAPGIREADMQVQNELGVVETADVQDALEGHFEQIRGCYQRAGKAQRYAGGKVTLRFRVAGSGQTDDVLVVESNLGNYGVERCLVDVGRRIAFKAPEGGKATTFDYPVEFRSTHELAVLDLNDGAKIEHDI